jgi:hypothetical protein
MMICLAKVITFLPVCRKWIAVKNYRERYFLCALCAVFLRVLCDLNILPQRAQRFFTENTKIFCLSAEGRLRRRSSVVGLATNNNPGRLVFRNKPYVNAITVIMIAEIVKCKFFLFVKI